MHKNASVASQQMYHRSPIHRAAAATVVSATINDIRDTNPQRENLHVVLPKSLLAKPGKYFSPHDYKTFDALKNKDVRVQVKDVLSFKIGDDLDDVVCKQQPKKKSARGGGGGDDKVGGGGGRHLGSVSGLEHYAYSMKLQQLRKLTQPAEAMQRRFRTAKLFGSDAVDRMRLPSKPSLYNSKASLAHTIGKKGIPEIKVNPRWTFMYKPEQLFMLRESHVPPSVVPAKFQVDRTVFSASTGIVNLMENDATGARAQLRDFFQIGQDFPVQRVTLGIAYKKPSGCFSTPGDKFPYLIFAVTQRKADVTAFLLYCRVRLAWYVYRYEPRNGHYSCCAVSIRTV